MTEQFSFVVVAFLSGFVVLLVLTTTAFTKISIVFFIIRNALGLQQTPSNIVLQTFALILAVYISMPVFTQMYAAVQNAGGEPKTVEAWVELIRTGGEPVVAFLKQNTAEVHKDYFQKLTTEVWKGSGLTASKDDLTVLVPAFMVTEISRAFEIGFLLYLPFVAIDIVLTVILMAMGMMMVPPTILSVPFKLLLFIAIGGWTKLVHGLVLSYGG